MVSESTGIILPWEQQTIRGEEMPDGLRYAEQILYLCLRMLYAQKKLGIIDRDTAILEKKKLLDEYQCYDFQQKMGDERVAVIKETELARAEFRKNPTVENAEALVEIIEGRRRHCL
jgi:hypothetical protein